MELEDDIESEATSVNVAPKGEAPAENIISTRHLYVPIRDLIMIVVFVISIMSAWGFYSSKINDMQTQIADTQLAATHIQAQISKVDGQQLKNQLSINEIKTAMLIKFPTLQFPINAPDN
jgi:Tfp pilus assembly protein PilO